MPVPELTITEAAVEKIVGAKTAEDRSEVALRISAREDGAKFRYELKLVASDTKTDDDGVIELDRISVYLDSESADRLRGATLEYVDDINGSGLKFDNPNKTTLGKDPLAGRVQEILDDRVNPGLAGHGGHVSLMEIQDHKVILQFGGGCQGCGMVDTTLRDGVAATLQQMIPEITDVIDITDHEAGETPYYQA
jgi:Fe/S biogenesis protein NfuA